MVRTQTARRNGCPLARLISLALLVRSQRDCVGGRRLSEPAAHSVRVTDLLRELSGDLLVMEVLRRVILDLSVALLKFDLARRDIEDGNLHRYHACEASWRDSFAQFGIADMSDHHLLHPKFAADRNRI